MEAIALARQLLQSGDRVKARGLLLGIVKSEPGNGQAWGLLAETMDDPQQIAHCRAQAAKFNPPAPSPAPIPVPPQSEAVVSSVSASPQLSQPAESQPAPPAKAQPSPQPTLPRKSKKRTSGNRMAFVIGGLATVLVILAIAGVVFAVNFINKGPVDLPSLVPTPTLAPTQMPPVAQAVYPTFPPEWTKAPTATDVPTRTPVPPTETPTVTATSTETGVPTPTETKAPATATSRPTQIPPTPGALSTQSPPLPTSTPIVVVPPGSSGSFELGGQVNGITGSTAKMMYAGMTWVKVQDRWSPGATPGNGKIVEAHNQGFKILLSVLANNPSDISGGANFDSYAAYVGQLAALGADGIEVWNEMNLDREWPAGQINPATYTDLLRRSYNQIKARNPNTLVISGALSPTGAEGAFGLDHVWNDNHYLAGMVAAGAASYMDCVGVHYNEGILSPTQNTGDPRDPYYTRYYSGMVSTYYNAYGGARKLCFTELGYLTPEGYSPLPGAFAWAANTTLAEQAQWLGRAASLSKSGGVVRLMVVFNVDFTVYGADPQAGYAIIRPGGSCPACDSLRAVTGGR